VDNFTSIISGIVLLILCLYWRGHILNEKEAKAKADGLAHKQAMKKIEQDWLKYGRHGKTPPKDE
jgi:hypothetical protein